MNKDIEDLIIDTNNKAGRLVDMEILLEKIANEKSETNELNPRDREVLVTEIREFEKDLSEKLRIVFNENLEKGRKERLIVNTENQKTYNDLLYEIQKKMDALQKIVNSCSGLDIVCRETINQSVDIFSLRIGVVSAMEKMVRDILSKQTKANEQAAAKLADTANDMRNLFKKSLHIDFVLPALALILLALFGGIRIESLRTKRTCEDIFERFYSDKYSKEIAQPLIDAKKEAEEYLLSKKAEADNYVTRTKKEADEELKSKKKEAKEYLKEQMEDARARAHEEFSRRMELYAQNMQKEVDQEIKKSNSKEVK